MHAWVLFNMDYQDVWNGLVLYNMICYGVWGLFEIVILCQLAFGSCAGKKLVRSLLLNLFNQPVGVNLFYFFI